MTEQDKQAKISMIAAAAALALDLHHEQSRKAAPDALELIPYSAHLLGTAAVVVESPQCTAEHVAAAFLHDSVEDQIQNLLGKDRTLPSNNEDLAPLVVAKLTETFGDPVVATRVTHLVMNATEDRSQPKPVRANFDSDEGFDQARINDWKTRKADYRSHLGHESLDDALVSLADNIYNVRSLTDDLKEAPTLEAVNEIAGRFNAGTQLRVEHYRAIVAIIKAKGWDDILVRHLDAAVKELSRVAQDLKLFDPDTYELNA